jgi:hypothetical protein
VSGVGVVMVVRPRFRSGARCTCGWAGKPRVLLASAKTDAQLHAAQTGCRPTTRLAPPTVASPMTAPGILAVDCPVGCGAELRVPLALKGSLESGIDGRHLHATPTVEAPEMYERVITHLLEHLADARESVDREVGHAVVKRYWIDPDRATFNIEVQAPASTSATTTVVMSRPPTAG